MERQVIHDLQGTWDIKTKRSVDFDEAEGRVVITKHLGMESRESPSSEQWIRNGGLRAATGSWVALHG